MGLKKNTFLYQAALLALSNMALTLLGFCYRILLSRLAGPEGMGVYTLVMQVYTIVISVCLSGFAVAVTALSARMERDPGGVRRLVRAAMLCFLTLFALAAIPVALFHDWIATFALGDPRTADALWMVLACIFLTGFENILKAAFHGLRLVRHTACSEVGEQLLRIAAVTVLLLRFGNGDEGRSALLILTGMTLSELYSVLFLGISYCRRFLKGGRGRTGSRKVSMLRPLLRVALPSMATAVLANVFSAVATVIFPLRLMAAGYARGAAVGALGVLSGMAGPLMMLPFAFVNAVCTLLMPSISAAIGAGDRKALLRKVDKGIEVTGLIALPSTALLLPFVPLLSALLFGQTVDLRLALLLAAETVAGYYLMAANCMLNGMGRQRRVLVYAAAGEIVQLALVWVLTGLPHWNIYGYVTGMLAGDLLRVLLGFGRIYRETGVRPHVISNYIVPVAVAVILYVLARMLFFAGAAMGPVSAMLLAFGGCFLAYWLLLRLLGVRAWRNVRRTLFR